MTDAMTPGSVGFVHVPVMADEVIEWLGPVPAGLVVDATVGGAGHAQRILATYPHLDLVGLDRDPLAVRVATERLAGFGRVPPSCMLATTRSRQCSRQCPRRCPGWLDP